MSLNFINNPNNLDDLLKISDVEDLDVLVDYITDNGEGRITLDEKACQRLVACKKAGVYSEHDRAFISYEIRRFGGNTLTNIFRDARNSLSIGGILDGILPEMQHTVSYIDIVRDVALHLKVSFNSETSLPMIEEGILRKILSDSIEKMTAEERKALMADMRVTDLSILMSSATSVAIGVGKLAGFNTFKIAAIVANAVAKALLGKGLTFAGNRILMKSLSVVLGPIGWIVSGMWTLADMASPAYRVTAPCVIQVAYMRQKALMSVNSKACSHCDAPNVLDAKFCSECGKSIAKELA